jgi:hypothetical protein
MMAPDRTPPFPDRAGKYMSRPGCNPSIGLSRGPRRQPAATKSVTAILSIVAAFIVAIAARRRPAIVLVFTKIYTVGWVMRFVLGNA